MSLVTTKKVYSFEEYLEYTRGIVDGRIIDPVYEIPAKFEATKLNLHRMNRIYKHFKLSESLKEQVAEFDKKIYFRVITEPWCGDAAQSVPLFAVLEREFSELISLELILRDQNLDLMDQYLTNGTRSIPKLLVSFKENPEDVLFTWGPRPVFLQEYVRQAIAEGLEAHERNMNVQRLYAKDKHLQMQRELTEGLKSINYN